MVTVSPRVGVLVEAYIHICKKQQTERDYLLDYLNIQYGIRGSTAAAAATASALHCIIEGATVTAAEAFAYSNIYCWF